MICNSVTGPSIGISCKSELLQKWHFWQGVNIDLTCIRLLWYTLAIPNFNMNNIQQCNTIRYHKNTQWLWEYYHIICTLFSYRAKVYFICILRTVPNMNKIQWFICNISLQNYNIYEIMHINATFWHTA